MSKPEDFVIKNEVLLKCLCKDTDIVIPYGVVAIGDYAFNACEGFKNVTIPDSVKEIDDYAFLNCSSLKSLSIPDSVVRIGYQAFSGCTGITSITIGKNTTSIDSSAFRSCWSVESIVVDERNTTYDSRNNCNAIIKTGTNTLITGCQNTIIPNGVETIGASAFEYCDGLRNLVLPDSVKTIRKSAFESCINLSSITFGNGISHIEKDAFTKCEKIKNVTVRPDNTVYDSRNDCNAIIETKTDTLELGFPGTVIPDSVKTIGINAFCQCWGIKDIVIPDSVTVIEESAFEKCYNLKSVKIPESVIKIGRNAFSECRNLDNVKLPDNIEVGPDAFKNVLQIKFNNRSKGAPWGARSYYSPNRLPTKQHKTREKQKPSISTPFEGKKIAFIGIDLAANPDIKKILKSLGCSVVTKVSKNVDFMVYTKEMVGYSSDYRSAEFQRDNNKKTLWTYEEFLAELKKYSIDTAAVEKAGIIYPVDTPDKKLASFEKAVNDSIYFFHNEEILKFNDDFYEVEYDYHNRSDAVEFGEDVLELLMKYDINEIPRIKAVLDDIIGMCGCNECLNKVIAMCVATRMFFDPEFECKFRIYRDKYEDRGDYYMAYGEFNIPPALYWEINREHPFGFVSFVKQH